MRILVIDDNPDDRALARRALEKEFPELEIEEIRREYVRRYKQESVMRIDFAKTVRVAF